MPVSLSVVRAIKDKTTGIRWQCPKCAGEAFYTYGHPQISEFGYLCCKACDTPDQVWRDIAGDDWQIRQDHIPA